MDLSLERAHFICFNRLVNSVQTPAPLSQPSSTAKVVSFTDLRLANPVENQPVVLFEYEGKPGVRSTHQVTLTCTGEGHGGFVYFGGYDQGKFRIFRADCIHRVVTL